MIRLGAPIFEPWETPKQWAAAAKRLGFTAVYCPITPDDPRAGDAAFVTEIAAAASEYDLLIGEVGVWRGNLVSPDVEQRDDAVRRVTAGLALAERVGAACCVTLSGSREPGDRCTPHPGNFTADTRRLLVEQVQRVIDAVSPKRACFTLETMPWALPSRVDEYLALLDEVNRPGFAVHLDPVNLLDSPRTFLAHHALIQDALNRLGPFLKACHLKDAVLHDDMPAHVREVAPGEGALDLQFLLTQLHALPQDVPVLLEHLSDAPAYAKAFGHVSGLIDRTAV